MMENTIQARIDAARKLQIGRLIIADDNPDRTFVKWDAESPTAAFRGAFLVWHPQGAGMPSGIPGAAPDDELFGWHDGFEIKAHCFPRNGLQPLETVADKFGRRQDSPEAHFLTAIVNILIGDFSYGLGIYAAAKNRWP